MEILIGQIPEAVYFAIFMILVKELKEKRLLYIALMILDYVALKLLIKYSMYFQLSYMATSYILLKVLYKEKAQLTDIFTFMIGSIILILSSAIFSLPKIFLNVDYVYCVILNRIFLFTMLYKFRHSLNKIQLMYKKLWNRNDKVKKKIKSTTFRSINIIAFNIMFYVIHLGMLYVIYFNGK